jgi:hypothetical protein
MSQSSRLRLLSLALAFLMQNFIHVKEFLYRLYVTPTVSLIIHSSQEKSFENPISELVNDQIKLTKIAATVAEIFGYKTSPMEISLFDKFLCYSYYKYDHKFFTKKSFEK